MAGCEVSGSAYTKGLYYRFCAKLEINLICHRFNLLSFSAFLADLFDNSVALQVVTVIGTGRFYNLL